jgi:2-polyprenyl-6-methoxyphenol hydroxylase-like FAD-dependent oxidoreductase
LPADKYRWTFQLLRDDRQHEFPDKERRAVRVAEPAVDERIRQSVQAVAQRRAPWFTSEIKTVTWCTEVLFQPGLARSFGQGRCWLAGDAAHQTGPVGVQSMNAGFREGKNLADSFRRILRGEAPVASLADYDREQMAHWRQLLGISGGLKAGQGTDAWLSAHRAKILPCLPATGADLVSLAQALKLSFT